MRFQFESTGPGGLPIIPVIPDHRLLTIEGRNGIGKTLAARVLEFISGEQPFTALPNAWESFCTDLGRLTVTIDGLPAGRVIKCELDSKTWVGRRESECVVIPGAAFINDETADWSDVRRIIQVRRIAGDEGLTETLARTLREASVSARRLDQTASTIVRRLGDELRLLTDDLIQVRSEGLAEDVQQYRSATGQLANAQQALTAAQEAHEQIVTAYQFHRAIDSTLEKLPALVRDYGEALARHQSAESAVAAADKALTETGRQQKVDADKARQIEWLVGRLPHRLRHLANAQVAEQQAHVRLGVTERLSPIEIRDRIRQIDVMIKALEEENRSAYLAGTVRDAQIAIEGELRAMPRNAQNERIATIGRDIRVHELADGISTRRKQLEGVPKPDEVAQRERTILQLRNEQMWVASLPDIYKRTEQKQKLVDEGTSELALLRGNAEDGDALAAADASAASARRDLLIAAVSLRECLAAIEAAIGLGGEAVEPGAEEEPALLGGEVDDDADDDVDDTELPVPRTLEEVEATIAAWLAGVTDGIDKRFATHWDGAVAGSEPVLSRIERCTAVLAEVLATLAKDREAAQRRRDEAAVEVSGAIVTQRRAEDVASTRLERLGMALRTLRDDGGPWGSHLGALDAVALKCGLAVDSLNDLATGELALSDLLEEEEPRGAAIAAATRFVEAVAEITAELESSAVRVRDQWSNAANYLYKFSGDLSTRLDHHPFDERSMRASAGKVLTEWAESTISELLSSPELRAELFDNSASVTFNISDLTVSWIEPETKRRRRRPLEAFSSGEQVFAYTKAKLERLRSLRSQAETVVVFLDEFGAFVARDRFAQLVTYVQHDALGVIADQIVVTVPLSGELEQVRDNASLANVEAEVYDPPGYVVIPANVD